ncbi:MAG: (2Fe-2S) ferredoxin domain-containing protein [Thermosynechococcaceae cyanobacterium]
MSSQLKYRVFVCTKQRHPDDPEGCCHSCGGMEVFQAFQQEIRRKHLENQVEIRSSGCLDRCESGAVALVYQPSQELPGLPMKLREKLLKKLPHPTKHMYGSLKHKDIPAIVDSHFIKGQPLKSYLI